MENACNTGALARKAASPLEGRRSKSVKRELISGSSAKYNLLPVAKRQRA
jgi:hypothetical protein